MTNEVPGESYAVFVGGYTAEMDGASTGISCYLATGADAEAVEFTEVDAESLVSPSFLIKHPLRPLLFAVSESSPGRVSAFRFRTDGSLELVNTVESGGDGGCHLCFDATFGFVLVAHYGSGSVACFTINDDDSLSERTGLISFEGHGPDPERQDASHAHQVVSVGQVILVPDLGTDSIHIVSIDADGGLSAGGESISLPAGSGPRHLVMAGSNLVVACELSAEVWISPLDAAFGSPGSTVPASTKDTDERVYPSAIAQFRDEIVVANRGSNTLSRFSVDGPTLTLQDEIDCGGSWPRDLTIDGNRLWVANQGDDTVTVFVRERAGAPAGDGAGDEAGDGAGDEAASSPWSLDFQLPTPDPACVIIAR